VIYDAETIGDFLDSDDIRVRCVRNRFPRYAPGEQPERSRLRGDIHYGQPNTGDRLLDRAAAERENRRRSEPVGANSEKHACPQKQLNRIGSKHTRFGFSLLSRPS